MSESNKSIALTALFWSALETVGEQAMRFVMVVILARLLMPEDFGQIAIILVFILIGHSAADFGFNASIVQRHEISHIDQCSVFFFNIFLGAFSTILLFLAASPIANFYEDPALKNIVQVLSLSVFIQSLSYIHISTLTRRMDFKAQFAVGGISTFLSGSIGVTLASMGFGVWALVAQMILYSLVKVVLVSKVSGWRPTMEFSSDSLRLMFPFGWPLFLSGLVDTIFTNIYSLVIGKSYSATDVGYYSRANGFQQLFSGNLSMVIGRVTFPLYSRIRNDSEELKRVFFKTVTGVALIIFPIMVGIAASANHLIVVLFTNKWESSVIYLQILCCAGLFYPLSAANLNVLRALGKSKLFLKLEIIKKSIVAVVLLISFQWGIVAIAVGAALTSVVGYGINAFFAGRHIGCSIFVQLSLLLPVFLVALSMGAVVHSLNYVVSYSHGVMLLMQLFIGVAFYAVGIFIFSRPLFNEVLVVVKSVLGSAKRRS